MKQKKTEGKIAAVKHSRVKTLKRLLRHMGAFWYLYLIVAITLLTAVLLNAAVPQIIGRIIDEVILDNSAQSAERSRLLGQLLWTLLLCGVGHAVFNYFKEFTADVIGSKIGRSMRTELFDHIQRLDIGFFARNNTGELMARIKDDIDKVWFILGFAGMLICECIIHTVVTLICMIKISPLLTVIPLIVMVIVAILAGRMEKQLDKCFDAISEENAEMNTVAQENLAGVRTVKAFSREQFEIGKFRKHNEKYYNLNMELAKTLIKHQPYISLATRILVVAVIITGGIMVINDFGGLTLGDIGAFSEYANNIIWPMECLAWLANELASAVASNRKIMKILAEQPEITNPENALVPESVKGSVEFDNVSFSIDGKKILSNVSFSLESGKTLGIMGLTGSGKSTVINLLERFYDAESGSVRLDGNDVRTLDLSALRGNIAVVMQDVFLFSDSITENISMGKRGQLTEADMRAAAEAACATEFIDKLEEDFETIIGERGVGLSGGQKQRISIARAFAKKSPVLVLDDATSALDMETEYELQQALSRFDATKIIIAHRISAVKDADEIIVLEEGRVIERGTHSQLMAKRGQYFATYVAQYSTEEDLVPENVSAKEAVNHVC